MSFLDRFRFKKKPFKEMSAPEEVKKGEGAPKESKKEGKKNIEEKTEVKTTAAVQPSGLSSIINHPFLSEKASLLSEQGKVVFEVDTAANKTQITSALKALYGVAPRKINVLKMRSRWVHYGKTLGKTRARKKVIATFPAGTKIDVYK